MTKSDYSTSFLSSVLSDMSFVLLHSQQIVPRRNASHSQSRICFHCLTDELDISISKTEYRAPIIFQGDGVAATCRPVRVRAQPQGERRSWGPHGPGEAIHSRSDGLPAVYSQLKNTVATPPVYSCKSLAGTGCDSGQKDGGVGAKFSTSYAHIESKTAQKRAVYFKKKEIQD